MALKPLDIFKLTPKKNCKACGCPTCMAFSMKAAQGSLTFDKCPHLSEEAIRVLAESTAPLMKTVTIGAGDAAHKLGGETVLFRHEKTLVNRNLFAVHLSSDMGPGEIDERIAEAMRIDYERIGEREYVECLFLHYAGNGAERYVGLAKKAAATGRVLILNCPDPEVAGLAIGVCKDQKPVLDGADQDNLAAMNAVAAAAGVTLAVTGADIGEIHDNVKALEAMGNRDLMIDCTGIDAKETFSNAVLIRRSNLKDEVRAFGYPCIVDLARIAKGDIRLQTALASAFILRYGAIIVMERMTYAEALALYGLRQNIYTDPQKPMKVEPGIYPINGADENSVCSLTVDFALTYFLVSGEYERSRCPVNLLVADAGGMSVLTAWAAGKLSAGTIRGFFEEAQIERRIKSRTLIIPGKVAVLKRDIEEKLPGWRVVVGPMEAVQLVSFIKEFSA
ncbi:MAG: acetyl-CoA decarbonylase/synthase complex subunit gamma [Clostridia bacterium]|nr:acetyl-CoA decarbonylase/synthase complex subunit gamma [Clostridia bacterium]